MSIKNQILMLDHFKREFIVRYRLPRPVSRAYEMVSFSEYEDEIHCKVSWCAGTAVRFLAAVRQANLLCTDSSLSVNPPSYNDFKMDLPGSPFPRETSGKPGTGLLQLAGILGGSALPARETLFQALSTLDYLARYRLVIVEPYGFRVLMGPRVEYLVWEERDREYRRLHSGTVLLVDAETGGYISLNPLLIWHRERDKPLGHLYVLRRIEGWNGIYREDGIPGTPSRVVPFKDQGRPVRGMLDGDSRILGLIKEPPVRFSDSEEKGPYCIEGLIWRGGLSDVYIAENRKKGKRVILKTYKSDMGGFDENYWRFVNEQKFSAGIEHDGVVRPRPGDFPGEGLVYEQDYMGGGSLNDFLEDSGVINAMKAKDIVINLLDILAAIHDRGIAHNDIKPDNILFNEKGEIRLIDFGIAHNFMDSKEPYSRGAPAGTREYMSPDLVAGSIPSVQGDLFSLAVVFGQMLSGRILRSMEEVAAEKAIPHEFHGFFDQCLAPRPEESFKSARDGIDHLKPLRVAVQSALTLDIEGTLVTNYYDMVSRPGLGDFIEYCLSRFDRVCVYTLLDADESREVFTHLADTGSITEDFLERYEYIDWPRGSDGSVKDLRRCSIPVEENIIVDDMEEMVPEEQHFRLVHIPGYHEERAHDRGLFIARKRIEEVLSRSLVRSG